MESEQFDHLAYRVAARSSRRGLLGVLAGAGVLAKFGLDESPQRASAEGTCTLDLIATVRLGPNAGQFLWAGGTQPGQIHGRLSFGVSPEGILTGATFQLDDGSSLPAVGQATGYSLQARIALGDARALVLTGVGEQTIAICQGAVSGLLSGPQPGDLGDWQATASGSASGAAVPTPLPAPVVPTPPQDPAGSGCSEGLIWCGQYCANLSSDAANCGYCGTLCGEAESCIDGICLANDFCQAGMTNCGDMCFDLTSDYRSCGACFVECGQDQVCWDGVCTKVDNCADGLTNCEDGCVDILSNSANCGSCRVWCNGNQYCSGGKCVTLPCKEDGQPCTHWINECCSGHCSMVSDVCFTP